MCWRYILLFFVLLPQYIRCFIAFFKFAGLVDWQPEVMYILDCLETYPIVFIPLIRLSEPLIIQTLREDLRDFKEGLLCWRRRKLMARRVKDKAVKQNLTEDSLFSFLNSQLNVEYVYLVLTGIAKLMRDE